jgi:hypothetical protein
MTDVIQSQIDDLTRTRQALSRLADERRAADAKKADEQRKTDERLAAEAKQRQEKKAAEFKGSARAAFLSNPAATPEDFERCWRDGLRDELLKQAAVEADASAKRRSLAWYKRNF